MDRYRFEDGLECLLLLHIGLYDRIRRTSAEQCLQGTQAQHLTSGCLLCTSFGKCGNSEKLVGQSGLLLWLFELLSQCVQGCPYIDPEGYG